MTWNNLPSGVTDADVDALYGDHRDDCEAVDDEACTCAERDEAEADERAIDAYESDRYYARGW